MKPIVQPSSSFFAPAARRAGSRLLLALSVLALPQVVAAASDPMPGAYVAAPVGTRVLSFLLLEREVDGPYVKGVRLGTGKMVGRAAAVGLTLYDRIGDMTAAWSVLQPYIEAHRTEGRFPMGYGEPIAGPADLRLGLTVWPVNDPDGGQWLGVGVTVMPPSGQYDGKRLLNPGDDRWKAVLALGWVRRLAADWSVELVPEVTFYETNDNYYGGRRMEQQTAYGVTGYLRWKFAAGWESQVGVQENRGGGQTVNGRQLNNAPENQRVFLGLSHALARNVSVGLRYSSDTRLQGDLRNVSEWSARMSVAF